MTHSVEPRVHVLARPDMGETVEDTMALMQTVETAHWHVSWACMFYGDERVAGGKKIHYRKGTEEECCDD